MAPRLPGRMLSSRWQAGPAPAAPGELLVSLTDFRADRHRDLPGVALAGRRLGERWPQLTGAVGMWLWMLPLERRCGSLSVWTGEDALRGFVRLPAHLEIVRRYRSRGSLVADSWTVAALDRGALWREAHARLAARGRP